MAETGEGAVVLPTKDILSRRVVPNARLRAWVAGKTGVGGIVFVILRDGTGYLQSSAKKGVAAPEVFEAMRDVPRESVVIGDRDGQRGQKGPRRRGARGRGFPGGLQSRALADNKDGGQVRLIPLRHAPPEHQGQKSIATMKIRAEVMGACCDYFRDRGFTLISAPTFVQAAVEGGSTLFEVGYFGKKAYLSQSAQFYEEAALAGLEKVWICQPAFRAEKSRTAKHLTEFWMVEAERAFVDQEANMRLQEELVAFIVERVLERRKDELATLGRAKLGKAPTASRAHHLR